MVFPPVDALYYTTGGEATISVSMETDTNRTVSCRSVFCIVCSFLLCVAVSHDAGINRAGGMKGPVTTGERPTRADAEGSGPQAGGWRGQCR